MVLRQHYGEPIHGRFKSDCLHLDWFGSKGKSWKNPAAITANILGFILFPTLFFISSGSATKGGGLMELLIFSI